MTEAIVLITAESGYDASIVNQLEAFPETKHAFGTLGKYDVIARFASTDEKKLEHILKDVRNIDHIIGVLTLHMRGKESLLGKKLSSEENEILDKFAVQAYVTIRTKNRTNDETLKNLGKIPEVIEGDLVIGQFDIIVRIVAPTYNELSEIVTKKNPKV